MNRKLPWGHTFDPQNTYRAQSEGAIDNRMRFMAYCINNNMIIMNTQFQKQESRLATYAEPVIQGPPYTSGRYEMIDYILTTNRWKNTIGDVEADPDADIDTRHRPLKARTTIKLKHEFKKEKPIHSRPQYEKCNEIQRGEYNHQLEKTMPETWTYTDLVQEIPTVAENCIPSKQKKSKQDFITKETERKLQRRRMLRKQGVLDETMEKDLDKDIRKSLKQDKKYISRTLYRQN